MRRSAALRIAASLVALATAGILLWLGVEPVPTWFYVFAWVPTLALLDGVIRLRGTEPSPFARLPAALSLLGWSPALWLVFEAANLRLENWYYVSLPAHPVERWAGIVLSFATVVPAIVLAERALAVAGVGRRTGGRRVLVRAWHLRASVAIALAALALVLAWPARFFPLVWGVGLFLAEPLVYRRAPQLSLFRDLERGDWGRCARLLLGGLGIGFLWESYNHVAVGRWIYTVPGLDQLKLFEMPPLGFVGFPVFALEAWALYAALCALGVAVPVAGAGRLAPGRALGAGVLAAGLSALVLMGMERRTISSTVPALDRLPGVVPAEVAGLRAAGLTSPTAVARASADRLADRTAIDPERARAIVATARLVMHRGMGAEHARTLGALGVAEVCDLVDRDAPGLAAAMRRHRPAHRPTPAEAQVWIRAARRRCGGDARPG